MKKLGICLVIFISVFIGIKNINAQVIYEDEEKYNAYVSYTDIKRKFELNNNQIVVSGSYKSSGSSRTINCSVQLDYTDYIYIYDKSNTGLETFIMISDSPFVINGQDSNGWKFVYPTSNNFKVYYLDLATNRTSSNMNNKYGYYGGSMDRHVYGRFRLNNHTILDLNSDFYLSNNMQTSYTYHNFINCNGISKIEVVFDVPANQEFNFDLDFNSYFINGDLPKPYLEYTTTFGEDNHLASQIDDFVGDIIDTFSEDRNGNEIYQYTGTQGITWQPLTSLKIIIDVSNYGNYDLELELTSNISFNVNTISVLEEYNYWFTLDLTNKYGVYLIPKTLNQDVYQTINLVGAYDIQVRSNYISDDNFTMSDFFLNYTEPNFQYLFSLNDINTLLYFMNANYVSGTDTGHYITFDSRYFTYAIKESQFQEPVIYNPNTGQDITITDPVDIDDTDDVKSFVKTIQLYLGKFSELFTYLYNSFPPLLKRALTSLFLILIITCAVLIARGRR